MPVKKRKSATDQSFALSQHHTAHVGCQARKHLLHLPLVWMYNTMILEKAIFSKLKNLKITDQELYDIAVSSFNPSKHVCPICGAVGRFRLIQPYERYMISTCGSCRVETILSIRRFQCESCGHTHALLPDVLIPYGSYSLRFILTILSGYLKRSCPIVDFCRHWNIAVSTLYEWIHLFIDQYNAWCGILDRILWVSIAALSSVSGAIAFPSEFSMRFGFSFLRGRAATPSGSLPLPDRRLRACST